MDVTFDELLEILEARAKDEGWDRQESAKLILFLIHELKERMDSNGKSNDI